LTYETEAEAEAMARTKLDLHCDDEHGDDGEEWEGVNA
jgi:hypothetical protein